MSRTIGRRESRFWCQIIVLLGAVVLMLSVPVRSIFLAGYALFWIGVAGAGLCRTPVEGRKR